MSNLEFIPLTNDPIPALSEELLSHMNTPEDVHAMPSGDYDALLSVDSLKSKVGTRGIALECGGNSIRGSEFIVTDDGTIQTGYDFVKRLESKDSEGYLEILEEFANHASQNNLPVGIAFGGPIDGTKPLVHPKFSYLKTGVDQKYDGDLKNLFSKTHLTVLNDAPAGLVSGAFEVAKEINTNPEVFYFINGGGVGLGVYSQGKLIATEAGHLETTPSLNPFNAHRPCGVYGDYTCFENLISNKRGIETQWLEETGEQLSGKEIEDRFLAGSALARKIFQLTAEIQANLIVGTAKVLGINIENDNVSIVFHGGANKTPGLKERTAQIVWQRPNPTQKIILTSDYHENACELGIAYKVISELE